MNILLKILLLSIISSCCSGQHAVVISGHPVTYNKHYGYLQYISGESIKGTFQYADMEFPGINIKLFDSAKGTVQKRIPAKHIRVITLMGHDPALNDMDSTYFVRIDAGSGIFRQLTFGDTKIFDDLFSVDENPGRLGHEIIIISGFNKNFR